MEPRSLAYGSHMSLDIIQIDWIATNHQQRSVRPDTGPCDIMENIRGEQNDDI